MREISVTGLKNQKSHTIKSIETENGCDYYYDGIKEPIEYWERFANMLPVWGNNVSFNANKIEDAREILLCYFDRATKIDSNFMEPEQIQDENMVY